MKCKFCYSKLNETDAVCGVCKIPVGKNKKELSKEEKKIRYYCHALHVVGFLGALGGAIGVVIALLRLLQGPRDLSFLLFALLGVVLSGTFLYFGFSIMKYKKWCYAGGIILLSLAILMSFLEFNPFRLLIQILLLSYVAAPTSRKILYREL
jgi:hypothetical protein